MSITHIPLGFYNSVSSTNAQVRRATPTLSLALPANYVPGQLTVAPNGPGAFSASMDYNVPNLTSGNNYTLHYSALLRLTGSRKVEVKWNGTTLYTYDTTNTPVDVDSLATANSTGNFEWSVTANGSDVLTVVDSAPVGLPSGKINYHYRAFLTQ